MSRHMTIEKKKDTRNGILRMGITIAAVIIDILIILFLFTKLRDYAEWINVGARLIGTALVLVIYSQHKTATMKMPWIILILSVPVTGVVTYLLVALSGSTRKMRQRYEAADRKLYPFLPDHKHLIRETFDSDPQSAGIMRYIAEKAPYPPYEGTEVRYFSDAEEGLLSQIEDLRRAEKFIFMEYFAIEDREAWHKVQEVLEERVKAGVEVRVFYDDVGSISFITGDFVKRLERVGIACRAFNPVGPVLRFFLNHRDHRKITVIDGKIGYTGGYNMANEYFNYTHPYGMWKDTGIRLEGAAVTSMTVMCLEMWNAVKGDDRDDFDVRKYFPYAGNTTRLAEGIVQPYCDSPMDNEHVGEDVYISMLEAAGSYCYFTTPYLIITDEMAHAMTLAAKRGVDVRIITPGIPDKKIVYSVTRSFYGALVRDGVRIYEWEPGFIHSKMCIIDDKAAVVGTINLDYRSLYHHFEDACFLYRCEAVKHIKDDFDATFAVCRDVTEQYRSRTVPLRFGQLFLRLFAELL